MGHPDEVMAYLAGGNERYVSGLTEPRDYAAERAQTYRHQEPIAAVLACSDSRVPVEQIFDCGLGDLIVVRTAGHVTDDAVMRTLAFAVEELGVGAIIVLGHTNCGAVAATSRPVPAGSGVEWLAGRVRMSLVGATADEPYASEIAHARATARSVGGIGAVREGVASGRLTVRPSLYDLETGRVTWLEPSA
jgi:carbonic anhydrase